jgi:hypothetical protein
MNPKTTIGLVVALVIAAIGVWWARSSSTQKGTIRPRAGPVALFDPALGELAGFEVKAGDSPALVFAMEDGKWRMTAPISGPTEHYTVSGDARKISSLQYVKAYAPGDPERPTSDMTSLDSPSRIVKLTDEDGKSSVVKIGARQTLSNKTYVQKEGDETVYLVEGDLNKDLRRGVSDYRGKRVAEFSQSDAVRIEVAGQRQYTLVKSDGKWTIESPIKGRADAGQVRSLLSSLSGTRVEAFVDDAPKGLRPYGLETPRLKVAVTTETRKEKPPPPPPASAPAEPEYEIKTRMIRLAFGGTADDKVFAKMDEASSPTVFQVNEGVVERITPVLDDLRDKKITTINTKRAQKVVVSSASETVELVKSGGRWEIAGGGEGTPAIEAEFGAVDDLLKAVRDLKAIGFEAEERPAQGWAAPRATIEVTAEGQLEPARLVIGGLTPSKTGAYVRNEREGFIAVVKAESAEALVVTPLSFLSRELLKFAQARASKIELTRQGRSCVVSRADREWKFVSPVEGPAESGRVNDILSDLSNLRGRRVVGRPAEASKFGLSLPSAVKTVVTVDAPPQPKKTPTTQPAEGPPVPAEEAEEPSGPPTVYTVVVARHGDKVYAMIEGGATICEADGKVLDNLEAELFDTRVATIDPSAARRLSFGGPGGFTLEKKGDRWLLAGETSFAADASKITNVFEAIRDLRAERFVRYEGANPAEFGLDEPAVVLTAQTDEAEGVAVTIRVSATGPADGGRYAAVSSAQGRVFVIKSEDVEKLAKQVKDFQSGR